VSATEETLLPRGWKKVRVKDVADAIQYGYTASAISRKNGPRLLRITDIQNGHVDWNAVPSCDIPEEDIPKYRLSPGDLVFARTGATTGKSFLIGDCPEAVFASYLIRVRASVEVSPRYLSAYFQSPDYWRQIESGKRGVGQPNVNGKVLGEVEFPLAPLNEQHEIVAEIEKQFTRLEAGVAGLRRAQANLKRYRAAVLKAGCEGKLVPTEAELARREGRTYETGAQLLERILTERRQKWNGKGKYKEAAIPDTTNLPPLSEGWTWAIVEQIALRVTYGVTVRPKYVDTGIRLISAREITGGTVNLRIAKMIAETDFASLRDKCRIYQNDVLFSKTGTIGKVAHVSTDERLAASQNIAVISPLMNSLLLQYILMSPRIQDLARQSVKITAIPDLQLGQLSNFPIPLPPLDEQKRIVAELERRLSVVEELEAVVSANLRRATRLRQSILQQAFSGNRLLVGV
jgi:type I restriction enzyme S subunit